MERVDYFYFWIIVVAAVLFVAGFWMNRRIERSFIDDVMRDDPDMERDIARKTIRVATTRHKLAKCDESDVAVWCVRESWPRYVSRLERTRRMMMAGYVFVPSMSLSWALKVWG